MNKTVSVIIPVFNEEENIALLYEELSKVLLDIPYESQVIFVDDGSIDKSVSIIQNIVKQNKAVKGVILNRNYGQTAAIVAGIDRADGEFIISMDADMQNDPKDIPRMLSKIEDGYDVVSGWRRNRKDSFLDRRFPSIIANYMISRITGLKLHDYGCTLKVYRKSFLKKINLYGEMHRLIPIYVYSIGGKVTEMEVHHRERKRGRSKYGINRIFKVPFDLITVKFLLGDHSTSPLYFFGKWGVMLMTAGMVCAAVTLVEKIVFGFWVYKNPLILLAVFLFIIGTQAIFMGLLAELSMRIYYETTKKSIYAVREYIT